MVRAGVVGASGRMGPWRLSGRFYPWKSAHSR
jgi:hypothetical protein